MSSPLDGFLRSIATLQMLRSGEVHTRAQRVSDGADEENSPCFAEAHNRCSNVHWAVDIPQNGSIFSWGKIHRRICVCGFGCT